MGKISKNRPQFKYLHQTKQARGLRMREKRLKQKIRLGKPIIELQEDKDEKKKRKNREAAQRSRKDRNTRYQLLEKELQELRNSTFYCQKCGHPNKPILPNSEPSESTAHQSPEQQFEEVESISNFFVRDCPEPLNKSYLSLYGMSFIVMVIAVAFVVMNVPNPLQASTTTSKLFVMGNSMKQNYSAQSVNKPSVEAQTEGYKNQNSRKDQQQNPNRNDHLPNSTPELHLHVQSEVVESAGTIEPIESVETVEPTEPAKLVNPVNTAQSVESEKSVKEDNAVENEAKQPPNIQEPKSHIFEQNKRSAQNAAVTSQ